MGYNDSKEPLMVISGGQMTIGVLAVHGFFILSGFLISASWHRCGSLRKYLLKRVTRIYPAYVTVFLLTFFLLGPLITNTPHYWSTIHLGSIVRGALLLVPMSPDGVFTSLPMPGEANSSLWTIQYEFWCYLYVATLGILLMHSQRWLPLIIFIASIIVMAIGVEGSPWTFKGLLPIPWVSPWPNLLADFFAGASFYSFRSIVPRSKLIIALSLLTIVGATVTDGLQFVLPCFGGYTIFYFAFSECRATNWFRENDYSYGVYLYAWPVQQLVMLSWGGGGGTLQPIILFLISMPIILLSGMASWFCVERRFLRSRLSSRRRTLESTPTS